MQGARVAVTGSRRGAELAAALERHGASVLVGPTVSGDVVADEDSILADTQAVLDVRPRWFVATTGVGMRTWIDVARRAGLEPDLRDLAESARRVSRSPKATGGLAGLGVRPEWTSPNNTDRDVLAWLRSRIGPGDAVVAQLHGGHTTVYDQLVDDGADLLTVLPYRWGLPDDPAPAHAVIHAAIDGRLDVITFTSAGAVSNLFTLAQGLGVDTAAALRRALAGPVAVASVGPVTAEAVEVNGGVTTIMPRRWRTADLVRAVETWWQRRDDASLALQLRLHPERSCAEYDGRLFELGPREYAVLAALARRPGVLVRTEDLVVEGWGHQAPADASTVKHQVARLRRKLSHTNLTIETVRGGGYRIVAASRA